jgi:segregation and condensation protein B
MDETEIKHVIEAALLAAGRPLTLDRLQEIFAAKGGGPDRVTLKRVLEALAADYQGRGIELKEVATGYRVQVKGTMTDWLQPLWEERAPRYTRALLETLALVAYRQPITRAEIEEVRGVVVSTNIVRTLLERNWIRVVGHRDVPGKPAMFGTTKEFLDYFGLKRLEDLPTLAELKDGMPELSPQTDLVESLEADAHGVDAVLSEGSAEGGASVTIMHAADEELDESDAGDDSELAGPDLLNAEDADDDGARVGRGSADDAGDNEDAEVQADNVIPLRAAEDDQ